MALAATVSNDGIVRTPGTTATGAFAVATVNVGIAGTVVASVDTGTATVPASFAICQTNAQAQCNQPPAASVTTSFSANQTGTFSIFVTSTGTVIPLDPAHSRAFVRFRTAGLSVGATSVAVQTQTTLGTAGGTLQLGPVGLTAPTLAAVTPTDFSATPATPPAAAPPGFVLLNGNSAFNISANNSQGVPENGLNGPVSMTVSYAGTRCTDPTLLSVMHFDTSTNSYSPSTILNIDTTAQTITFDSRTFSSFVLMLLGVQSIPATFNTGLVPGTDGFQIVNIGASPSPTAAVSLNNSAFLAPGGECLGMSSFALWYYGHRGHGLFSHYPNANPNPPNSVANLVALRSHVMQSVYWNQLYSNGSYLAFQRANPGFTQRALRAYLATFKQPIVSVIGIAGSPTLHAVLFYAYDANNFYFYDPNRPGTVQSVSYNANGFGTYAAGLCRMAIPSTPRCGRSSAI